MSKKGCGKFLAGAAIGAGLGLLFAPKKGSDTREDLKKQIDKLLNQIKDIDAEDVKKEFDLAVEKGTPVLQKAADDLRDKAIVVTKEVLKKLEKEDKK